MKDGDRIDFYSSESVKTGRSIWRIRGLWRVSDCSLSGLTDSYINKYYNPNSLESPYFDAPKSVINYIPAQER